MPMCCGSDDVYTCPCAQSFMYSRWGHKPPCQVWYALVMIKAQPCMLMCRIRIINARLLPGISKRVCLTFRSYDESYATQFCTL